MAIDPGFNREEVNTELPIANLANGQTHVVYVNRTNAGKTVNIRVGRLPNDYS